MKHFIRNLLIIVASLLLFSCSQNLLENEQNEECYITLNLELPERKISPENQNLDEISALELYRYGSLMKKWDCSETSDAKENAENEKISMEAGTYSFTLKAYNASNEVFADSTIYTTIVKGENVLSFNLKPSKDGKGQLNLNISWSADDKVGSVKAGIFSLENSSTPIEGYDYELLTILDDGISAVYEKLEVPAGNYLLKINFYSSKETGTQLIKNYSDVITIGVNKTSKAEINVQNINEASLITKVTSDNLDSYLQTIEDKEIPITIVIKDKAPNFEQLKNALVNNNDVKNISLDLSECTDLTEIPEKAFYVSNYRENCNNLVSVKLPETVIKICFYAFNDCDGLQSIQLPSSLKEIEYSAFYNCDSLKTVYIPESVNKIGSDAFRHCNNLESINIPSLITNLWYDCFSSCPKLTEIIVSPENAKYASAENGKAIVTKDGKTLIMYPSACGELTLSDEIEILDEYSLYSTQITSVIIGNNIKSIKNGVFSHCSNLTSITLGDNVTELTGIAFNGSNKLSNFIVSSANESYAASSDGEYLLSKDGKTIVAYPSAKGELIIDDDIEIIGADAFYNTSVSSITFGANVKTIGKSAFGSIYQLKSVTIPDTVETIEYGAFNMCGLTEVNLGHGVKTIGDSAFGWCKYESITIPASVVEIGSQAFYRYDSQLKNVYFEDSENWGVKRNSYDKNSIALDVTDSEINAQNFLENYSSYTWVKEVTE